MRKPPPIQVGEGFAYVALLGKLSNHSQAAQLRALVKLLETTSHRPPGTMPVKPRRLDHRFTTAEIIEIVDAYESGSSTNQLCKQYSISKGSLMKILQEHGVQTRFQPMTKSEIAHAAALYEAGDSVKTIAERLGKAKGSVWKALQERGTRMRPPTR